MMKIARIFALVFGLGCALLADDRFPAFETKAIEMKFPVRNFAPQLNSGEELSAGKLTSKFTGQIFLKGEGILELEKFSGSTDQSTPWKTLTELFVSYRTGDVSKIASFYLESDQPEVVSLFRDPVSGAGMIEYGKKITGAEVVLAIEGPTDIFALVRIRDADGVSHLPYRFVKINGRYKAAGGSKISSIVVNLITFLESGGALAEIEVL